MIMVHHPSSTNWHPSPNHNGEARHDDDYDDDGGDGDCHCYHYESSFHSKMTTLMRPIVKAR